MSEYVTCTLITNSPFEVLFQLDFVDAFRGLKFVVKDYVHVLHVRDRDACPQLMVGTCK